MKNKQIVVWIFIVVGMFGLLYLAGKSNSSDLQKKITSNQSLNKSQLTVPETFYDFSTISMKNGNVSKSFKVANKTNKDIFFPSLTTSCMCTSAYFLKSDGSKKGPFGMPSMGFVPKLNETIKAGEETSVEVVYDPNAHGPAGVGPIDRFIYLEDSDGGKIQFEIKANVTP